MRRFSSSPRWSLTNSCRASSSAAGFALHSALILLVEALHLGDGVGLQRFAVHAPLPPGEQHPELGAPIAQVIVGDDLVAQQAERARQTIAQNGRADMADVHGLGHVGRTEIDDHSPRLRAGCKEEVFSARRGLQGWASAVGLSRKFKEAGAGDFYFLAASATSSLATTSAANWRGFIFRALASDMRALVW
jgi:hypothetical protein